MIRLSATLLAVALVAPTAHASEPCLDDMLPFFQNFAKLDVTPDRLAGMLANACTEVASSKAIYDEKNAFDRAGDVLGGATMGTLMGSGLAAFDSMDKTPAQREYKAELMQLREIADPIERIRRVYELVARTQGAYDNATNGTGTIQSGMLLFTYMPSNLIDNADKRGTVGVCREMASLLHWSLMQVARHPSSKGAALGPNDFSATLMGGRLPEGENWDVQNHAWVRINLPTFGPDGRMGEFRHFDLDTTFNPEIFSPLLPRRSGLTPENRELAIRQCDAIKLCLAERTLRDDANFTPSPSQFIKQEKAQ